MAILISPMIVPLIISAAGMYFFYSRLGLQGTYWGVVLAHAVLGIPFVIITVTATLVGFDRSLVRAAANLGAEPVTTFFKVQMPLILPGVISGALFAFITSFDEVVVVLFVGSAAQTTLPWQMFTGLREQISPVILAVATVLVAISVVLLATPRDPAPPLREAARPEPRLTRRNNLLAATPRAKGPGEVKDRARPARDRGWPRLVLDFARLPRSAWHLKPQPAASAPQVQICTSPSAPTLGVGRRRPRLRPTGRAERGGVQRPPRFDPALRRGIRGCRKAGGRAA